MRVSYLYSERPHEGRPYIMEFFVSRSPSAKGRIASLDDMASQYSGRINVVMVAREERSVIEPMFEGGKYAFYVALDDGDKTFRSFHVQYVPFTVILDTRGRVVWSGNPSTMNDMVIKEALNW